MTWARPVREGAACLELLQQLSAAPHIGRLTLSVHWDDLEDLGSGYLQVKHADPRILVSTEMMHWIARGEAHPAVKLYVTTQPDGDLVGGKIEIHARDRKVVYRVAEFDAKTNGYIVEWPD